MVRDPRPWVNDGVLVWIGTHYSKGEPVSTRENDVPHRPEIVLQGMRGDTIAEVCRAWHLRCSVLRLA